MSYIFEITTEYASKEGLAFIKSFARKTGDIATLSEVDIELMGIAYDCVKKNNAQ